MTLEVQRIVPASRAQQFEVTFDDHEGFIDFAPVEWAPTSVQPPTG
jgi:hypothetical protein